MPTVPRLDTFNVTPTSDPVVAARLPDMPDAGAQAKQMGAAGLEMTSDLARIQMDMRKEADQVILNDALNQVKEEQLRLTHDKDAGYTSLKGINALKRPDGKVLADEYSEKLKQRIDEVSGGLGSDAQRQAFNLHANDMMTAFRGRITQHEAKESTNYFLSVSDGVQATALREIELNYNNPEIIDKAVLRIQSETYRQGQLLGRSAEWQEAQARKLTSNAHKIALLSALEQNDPEYADDYLKKYAAQMNGHDTLMVRGHITKEMDARIAYRAAGETMQAVSRRFAPTDFDRAFNILLGTESGGRQFGADGKPLTSKAGAIGIAQVMPGTGPEAAKLAGMAWDENRYKTDPEYNKALGRAYFEKQLKDFGGDMSMAYAAYNAGPGRVRDALKRAGRSAVLEQGDPNLVKLTWTNFLPQETQAYVAKNMKAYESGTGAPSKPTLLEVHQSIRERFGPTAKPAQVRMAIEESTRIYTEYDKAIKQQEEGVLAEAQRMLISNGGNYAGLPPAIRNNVPPGKVDDLYTFAGKIAKGVPVETDWQLFYQLKTNPDLLGKANLLALRHKLGETEFKSLTSQQMDIREGKNTTPVRTITDVMNGLMRQSGIDPTPKDTDKAGAEKVGKIWAEYESRVRELEASKGSRLTPDELHKTAAQMFTKVGVQGMLWGTNEKPAALLDKTDKIKVPDVDRKQIVAALNSARRPATEENILAIYRRSKGI